MNVTPAEPFVGSFIFVRPALLFVWFYTNTSAIFPSWNICRVGVFSGTLTQLKMFFYIQFSFCSFCSNFLQQVFFTKLKHSVFAAKTQQLFNDARLLVLLIITNRLRSS
ncbi:hypothetical protein CRENBAI_020837 [Crenichthys baileyi]|uniref:Secreted protein n=1 Tax=Crenichthys baileyi TaxID=28760 RepID=A0AAV9SA75_9TELE